MTSSTLTDLLLGFALIAYISFRQLTWRPVDPGRIWKMPIILGAVGIASMARSAASVTLIDTVILALSAVFAVASGALMGRIARFRPSPTDPRMVESRTGWLGVGIWIALIVVRVTLDLIGHRLGSDVAVATGAIIVMVALNRAASALVVTARQPHATLAKTGK